MNDLPRRRVVVLAGPVCAGKTTLATRLSQTLPAYVVSARELVARVAGEVTRESLQAVGRELERSTQGRWLADAVSERGRDDVVVDSARTSEQVDAIRTLVALTRVVFLDASTEERARRFALRGDPLDSDKRFEEVVAGELTDLIHDVATVADLVVPTDDLDAEAVHDLVLQAVA